MPGLKGEGACCCRSEPRSTSSELLKPERPTNAGGRQDGSSVGGTTPHASRFTPHLPPVLLGGHSEVDPRLPIPNRTVKRLCADDSADCPRESRSPPGAPNEKPIPQRGGLFYLGDLISDLLSERKHAFGLCPIQRYNPEPIHSPSPQCRLTWLAKLSLASGRRAGTKVRSPSAVEHYSKQKARCIRSEPFFSSRSVSLELEPHSDSIDP